MAKLKLGLVGCSRGKGIVKVFGAHPRAEVTALCDLDAERTAELGKAFELPSDRLYTDYAEFLQKAPLDAVIIATPIRLHAEQTVAALAAGKHVLCEQTVAYTVEDCARVVDAVKQSDLVYMMAENYCYFHYVREWRKIVEAGKIGEIYYAEGEYIHEILKLLRDPDTGEYHWRHERPPMWYCAHTLGPILLMMQDRIVEGCGLTSGFKRFPDYSDHPGYLDFEIGLFKTEKGAVVKILRSQTAARPHMVWYSLYGTKGHLENGRFDKLKLDGIRYFEGMDHKDPAQLVECPNSDPQGSKESKLGGHGDSEYFMIRDFLDAVENRKRPKIDVIRATEWTIPGIVAHESAMAGGKWMEVPRFDW
jgi:predicted dehydrogenase